MEVAECPFSFCLRRSLTRVVRPSFLRAEYTDLGCFPDAGHPRNGRYRLARDHGCK